MAVVRKKALGYKVEQAIVNYLKSTGAFKGCAVIERSSSKEAPDTPCIIVHCVNTSRTDDTDPAIYSKDANVTAVLYADSEETSQAKQESYALELECRLEDLGGMQGTFNAPASGRDKRKIRGMHLHYITEFQTTQETEGTEWRFGVGITLTIQETLTQ